jgi:hypothetical protein
MSPGQLAGATVQDSKAKRQERLKSRFRDRGGYVLSPLYIPGSLVN